jgi:cytoskeletal protein CcmA (bactofilin family)
MWRKPAEAKPSSPASDASVPASAKPQPTAPVAAAVVTPAPQTIGTPIETPPMVSKNSIAAQPASASTSRSASHISPGIRIKGEISGSEDLYIDGLAEGQFRFAKAKVTVGPNGRVQANIEARDIVVEGTVQGNLTASESVRLGASSQVQGSLITPRISIDDGARLRGKVEMSRSGQSRNEVAAAKPDSEPAEKVNAAPQAAARAAGE